MRSGTNQYHGSAYEYFTNEALNAAQPFVNEKPRTRQNDFGGTFGGPVRIPKVYNGTNKTFLFSYEEYRNIQVINDIENTVPTLLMRQGNFSQLPLIPVGVDPNNNNAPIFANTIYNPASNYTLNGVTERVPFRRQHHSAIPVRPDRIEDPVILPAAPGSGCEFAQQQ